jgi:hypothetical protein
MLSPINASSFANHRLLGGLLVLCLISSCGGDGSSPGASVPVTVAGLTSGTSLVLQDASGDSLTVSANGSVALPVRTASGAAYTLSISTQPTGEFCNVQNAAGSVGSTSIPSISCAQRLAGGTGSVAASGGDFTSPAADITIPSGSSLQAQTITVTTVAPPAGIPASLTPVGAAIDVSIDQPTQLNAPLIVNLRYDASIVADETNLAVIHYNTTSNRYEPVTVLAQDTTAHSFTITSRTFSPFLIVSYDPSVVVPASHMVTNFTPQTSGWNINNFSDYFSGGQCLGMSAFAIWYFQNEPGGLYGKFSSAGDPSVANILAVRAQLAENQYWALKSTTFLYSLGEASTAKLMKFYLAVFDQPLVLGLYGRHISTNSPSGHAAVLYGYDSNGFTFYDVNYMNESQTVTFDGTKFGVYQSGDDLAYGGFYYDAVPALGRTEDFAGLESEAESGFTSSSYITVTSPSGNSPVTSLPLTIAGTLSPLLDPNAQMIGYIGGAETLISGSGATSFSYQAQLPLGQSLIVLLAGVDESHLNNWYPNSAAQFFNVDVQVPVSIAPPNPTLATSATQSFSVQLPAPAPPGVTYGYSWTLSGIGSIGASGTVVTPAPNIVYTAPAQGGQATLSVSVLDAQGNTLGSGTDAITIGNPWVGTWVGSTVSTCGYYSGPQNFNITLINATTLSFGPYDATFSGNSASVNNGEVVFTLSGNTITGYEADSCQNGTYTRQ